MFGRPKPSGELTSLLTSFSHLSVVTTLILSASDVVGQQFTIVQLETFFIRRFSNQTDVMNEVGGQNFLHMDQVTMSNSVQFRGSFNMVI